MSSLTLEKFCMLDELEDVYQVDKKESPRFRAISNDEYRQLESGIYNTWGRRLNITPRVLDENGIWTGQYKDWSHLEVIEITQGYFDYLNCLWLFRDQRPTKQFKYYCKEAYIFDKKCIVIQQLEQDCVSAKILTNDEDLKIYIEDVLSFKPLNVVPIREIKEINDLEHQGLEFGSSQLRINMNTAEEKVDQNGLVITNVDHYDNYVYEVYDSLRNIFKHISKEKLVRAAESQCIWLENWLEKPLTNELNAILPYMTQEVVDKFKKYVYQNKDVWDRQACGSFLFEETKVKKFNIESLQYEVTNGKKMDAICAELDIPITIGWDIWKLLNKEIMREVIEELYEEYPL